MNSHFDYSLCTSCLQCSEICPSGIIGVTDDDRPFYRPDRVNICVRCGHCMAICSSKAAFVDGLDNDLGFHDLHDQPVGYPDFLEFLRHRRSVRVFQDRPVSREVTAQIIDAISESPYGVGPDNVHFSFILDRSVLKRSLPLLSDSYKGLGKMFALAPFRAMLKLTMPGHAYNTLDTFIIPHIKKGFYISATENDDILRNAPAMLLIHAPKDSGEHPTDSILYLTYAFLAMHSLGLGATIIGLVPPVVNRSKPLKKLYGIPDGNTVDAALIFGYPKYHFNRGIRRPRKQITITG